MNARTAALPVTALLLVSVLAGCTQTISGTPGPRPAVSGGGDFPTDSGSATDDPTSSEDPTSSDEPTDEPTDTDSPTADGSVQSLCSQMSETISGSDLGGTEIYQALIGLNIISWGLANNDSDPFSTVDAATTSTCPDVRTAVLAKTGTPDLKSTNS